MGGYSKVDKNKIQPSPALAFLNGLAGGINAKKKEMQDREDAQNKQAVDWYKAMQEGQYKDRMATVAERGATSEEDRVMTEQDRVMLESKRVDQAQQTINDNLNKTALEYKKFHLDLLKSVTDPIEKEKFEILQNNLQKGLEDYKDAIAVKADERKSKLLITQQSALETQRQAGDMATQTMIQAGQDRRNNADNARMASEGALNRSNDIVLANIRKQESGSDSLSPKVKAYNTRLSAYSNGLKTALTAKNTVWDENTIDMFVTQYETLQSEAEQLQNDPEVKDNIILPTPIEKIPKEIKKWARDKPASFKVGGTPTQTTIQPLSSGELKDYATLVSPAAKTAMKKRFTDEKSAYDFMIGKGFSNAVALKVLDEVYKK
jgi:hypothetical protein